MAGFQYPYYRPRGGWPGRRQLFLALIALVCLVGFYAVGGRHIMRPAVPRAPVVGAAWIVDGDSSRIGRVSIRLEGIDAPEWDQTCTDPG